MAVGLREPSTDTTARAIVLDRTYDPTTGTFLSPDPIDGTPGTPDEANPYDYVSNDPLNWTDPLGLSRTRDCDFHRMVPAGCPVLVDDSLDPYGTGVSNPGERDKGWWDEFAGYMSPAPWDPYGTYHLSHFSGQIYGAALEFGVDTRLLYGVVGKEIEGFGNELFDEACSPCNVPGVGSVNNTQGPSNVQQGWYDDLASSSTWGSYFEGHSYGDLSGDREFAMGVTAIRLRQLEMLLDKVVKSEGIVVVHTPGSCRPPGGADSRTWFCKSTLLSAAYTARNSRIIGGEFFRNAFQEGGFRHTNEEFIPGADGTNAVTPYLYEAFDAICGSYKC